VFCIIAFALMRSKNPPWISKQGQKALPLGPRFICIYIYIFAPKGVIYILGINMIVTFIVKVDCFKAALQ